MIQFLATVTVALFPCSWVKCTLEGLLKRDYPHNKDTNWHRNVWHRLYSTRHKRFSLICVSFEFVIGVIYVRVKFKWERIPYERHFACSIDAKRIKQFRMITYFEHILYMHKSWQQLFLDVTQRSVPWGLGDLVKRYPAFLYSFTQPVFFILDLLDAGFTLFTCERFNWKHSDLWM